MNKNYLVIACCLLIQTAWAQKVFTIEDVILSAQSKSSAYKVAETRRETRYWQYRYYKTNYNPQVQVRDNNGSLYNNSITPVIQPDGTIVYQPLNQINPGVNFALQQPIQWTGGTIAVNSSYNYFKDLVGKYSQWNGSPMNISLNQPLLSYNSYKWNKMIEPIKYEESKRDYAESMEQISHDAVNFFFTVMDAQVNFQIAKFNLAYNDTIYKIEQGRYNIGTTSEDKLLQVELQLLRSRQDVAKGNLDLQTSSLDLRTYIGLRNGEAFELVLPDSIPLFQISEDDALEYAKKTRSAFAGFERRKLEAKAGVAQTRGSLYQVGLQAAYGLNNVGPTLNGLYDRPTKQQWANVSFTIPVLDWGRRRAQMQTARANQRLSEYIIAQDEAVFEQQIRTQVRQFELLYLSIEITRKSDIVALKRYLVAQNRYLIGKVDITNLNIALNEKDAAKRAYINALRAFWVAFYDLRRLTLFDFKTNTLLYNPNPDQ